MKRIIRSIGPIARRKSSPRKIGIRLQRSTISTLFDDRGRVHQTIRYAVDPPTGTVGNSLVDNIWYDSVLRGEKGRCIFGFASARSRFVAEAFCTGSQITLSRLTTGILSTHTSAEMGQSDFATRPARAATHSITSGRCLMVASRRRATL